MWKPIEYDEKYLDDILAMTKRNYGDIEIANKGYIKHEYFNNPIENAVIQLAIDEESEGKVAGQYVIVPKRMCINGHMQVAGHPLNILVDKHYRKQGMFYKLGEIAHTPEKSKYIDFFYATPNQNSIHGYSHKLYFTKLGEIPLMLKPLSLPGIFKEKMLGKVTKKSEITSLIHNKALIYSNRCQIVRLSEDNIEIADSLWKEIKGKYPVMMCRNSEFIEWRYLNIPLRKYNCFVLIKDNVPIGFISGIITKVANMSCGMIVDFIFAKGEQNDSEKLLMEMIDYFKLQGATLSGCLMNQNTEEAKVLKKKGYFICPKKLQPQPFPILLRTTRNTKEEKVLENFNNWFFTMGDYDVI